MCSHVDRSLAEKSLDFGDGKQWTAQSSTRSKQSPLNESIQSWDAHSQGGGSFLTAQRETYNIGLGFLGWHVSDIDG